MYAAKQHHMKATYLLHLVPFKLNTWQPKVAAVKDLPEYKSFVNCKVAMLGGRAGVMVSQQQLRTCIQASLLDVHDALYTLHEKIDVGQHNQMVLMLYA